MFPRENYYTYAKGGRDKTCKDCRRTLGISYYKKGGERARKGKRDYMAALRSADPQAMRDKQRKYYATNGDRVREKNRNYWRKRFFAVKAGKLKNVSAKELASLWKRQRGICALTGRRLDRSAHVDHIMPKARGGSDALDNLRWVCSTANYAKRDLTDEEFLALCTDVNGWLLTRIEAQLAARADGRQEHAA